LLNSAEPRSARLAWSSGGRRNSSQGLKGRSRGSWPISSAGGCGRLSPPGRFS